MTTSDRVELVRRQAGHTYQELADSLGIHRISLTRKLQDLHQWRATELMTIAQQYDVPVGWLMGEEGPAK